MKELTTVQSTLVSILKNADRIDRSVVMKDNRGNEIEAYTFREVEYSSKAKKCVSRILVNYKYLSSNSNCWYSAPLEWFIDNVQNLSVIKMRKKESVISIENMARVINLEFDSDDYLPKENDEDEYGRVSNYGSLTSEVEIEEDDFYARFDVDITSRIWYYPATYYDPIDSGNELTSLSLYLREARRIDEDGEEHQLSDNEFDELETLLKEKLEVA